MNPSAIATTIDKDDEIRQLYDSLINLGKAASAYLDATKGDPTLSVEHIHAMSTAIDTARETIKRIQSVRHVKTAAPAPGLPAPKTSMPADLPKPTPVSPEATSKAAPAPAEERKYGRELSNGWTRVDWSREGEKLVWTERVTLIASKKTPEKGAEYFELSTVSGEKTYERKLWKNDLSPEYIQRVKSIGLGEELSTPLFAVMTNSLTQNEHGKSYKNAMGLISDTDDESVSAAITDYFKRKAKKKASAK